MRQSCEEKREVVLIWVTPDSVSQSFPFPNGVLYEY